MLSSPLFNFFLKYATWPGVIAEKSWSLVICLPSQITPPQTLLIVKLSFEDQPQNILPPPSTPTLAMCPLLPIPSDKIFLVLREDCNRTSSWRFHFNTFNLMPSIPYSSSCCYCIQPTLHALQIPGHLNLFIKIWILGQWFTNMVILGFLAPGKSGSVDLQWDLGTCIFTFVVILIQLSTWSVFYNQYPIF